MTKLELSKEIVNRLHKENLDSVDIVLWARHTGIARFANELSDYIFNQFESRTCNNCLYWSGASLIEEYKTCNNDEHLRFVDTYDNSIDDNTWMETKGHFGCNKWRAKDD